MKRALPFTLQVTTTAKAEPSTGSFVQVSHVGAVGAGGPNPPSTTLPGVLVDIGSAAAGTQIGAS